MQIKVTDTKMHIYKGSTPNVNIEVPVAKAKLILVGCDPKESLLVKFNGYQLLELSGGKASLAGFYYKPILISETEDIKSGELFTMGAFTGWKIEVKKDVDYGQFKPKYKIVALPEHFSPKHLQAIVDGKLNNGDEVLVECEREHTHSLCMSTKKCQETEGFKGTEHEGVDVCEDGCVWANPKQIIIKLNSSNHITLHKIEERIYTKEELRAAFDAGYKYGLEVERSGIYAVGNCFEEWFEQNVK